MMTWDVVSRRKARALVQAAQEAWQAERDSQTPFTSTAALGTEGIAAAPPNTTDDAEDNDVHVALHPVAPAPVRPPCVSYIVVDEELNEQLHSDSPPPGHDESREHD